MEKIPIFKFGRRGKILSSNKKLAYCRKFGTSQFMQESLNLFSYFELFCCFLSLLSSRFFSRPELIYAPNTFFQILFQLDAELSPEGVAIFILAAGALISGLIIPFLLCHFGTFAIERIRSIDLIAYNTNWLDYPLDLRKYIILMNGQTRSQIRFNGFNLITCNLEIFAKVLRIS